MLFLRYELPAKKTPKQRQGREALQRPNKIKVIPVSDRLIAFFLTCAPQRPTILLLYVNLSRRSSKLGSSNYCFAFLVGGESVLWIVESSREGQGAHPLLQARIVHAQHEQYILQLSGVC